MFRLFTLFVLLNLSLFSQFRSSHIVSEKGLSKDLITTVPAASKKSPALAILCSAILPGMGEWYGGDFSSGRYFTYAEAALLLTYIGMDSYSGWQKSNYTAFAGNKAGVRGNALDADFYANVGNYLSVQEYNNEKAFNRQFSAMYDVNTKYWEWKTTADRKNYRRMWVASQESNNNIRFVVGAMALNRLASIINAVRITSRYNREQSQATNLFYFDFTPLTANEGILSLNYTTSF